MRSHRVTALVLALIGGVIGAAVTFALPTAYTATSSVLVLPLEGNPYNSSSQGSDLQQLETEAQLVRADTVVRDVKSRLGSDRSEEALSAGLKVSISPNTQVISITFMSTDADEAEAVTRQFASSYLDHRASRSQASIDAQSDALSQRIGTVTKQLRELRKQNAGSQDPEVRALGGQLTNLRLQAAAVAAANASPGEMITAPEAARSGLSLPWWMGALAGLLVGAVLGLGWAMFRERRADLVRTIEDVEQFGLVVLSTTDSSNRGAESDEVADAARSTGNMVWRKADQPASVAVATIGQDAGVTWFGEGLAEVLVQGGDPTLLVDAVGSAQSEADGLSEVLARSRQLSTIVRPKEGELSAIGVGRDPEAADGYYPTSRMTHFLDEAADMYSWVVVQSPSVAGSTGRALVSACTHWVALVQTGTTTRHELARAITWSEAAGVSILGVVLVSSEVPVQGRSTPPANG